MKDNDIKKNNKEVDQNESCLGEKIMENSNQDKSNEMDFVNEIKKKDEEIAKLNDRLLRLAAEMQNEKRRFEKEISDSQLYAITKFAKEVSGILDVVEIAISHVKEDDLKSNNTIKGMFEGFSSLKSQIIDIFNRFNVKQIKPQIGDNFDHNEHQAISKLDIKDKKANLIAEVIANGYKMDRILLKPAMVIITA